VADTDTKRDDIADSRSPGTRTRLTSTLLITTTLIAAIACIIVLSCTLTQTRVSALLIEGVSIAKIDYVGRQWANLRKEDIELVNLEKKEPTSPSAIALVGMKTGSKLESLTGKLKVFYYQIENNFSAFANEIKDKKFSEQYLHIVGNKADLIGKDPSLATLIAEIDTAYGEYNKLYESQAILSIQAVERSTKAEQLKKHFDQIFDYIKPDLDKDARARVENAFYELSIHEHDCGASTNTECGLFHGLITRGLYHLMTLRPDLLTLMLVILMGVLGSALQITHAYFLKNQAQTVGGYFQRITVGAVTALVIFIVAKAGVPIIADASRLGGDASINPYFVSFLAIVSGLLSENAITNIQAQGLKVFGPGGAGPDRWARTDLTLELQAQSLSAAALANHLGVQADTALTMLKGEKEIDSVKQQLIAIYLRREPREIFTDIPPPEKQRQQ
jgi:hypothetical protein